MSQALPCVACGAALENVDDASENQPSGGTSFVTHGHYGSTVFDPMDGHYLEVNVCDGCLREAGERGRVLLGRDHRRVVAPVEVDGLVFPALVGYVRVKEKLVPWREEDEDEHDDVVIARDEIGSTLYPEIEYAPGILEAYGPDAAREDA